MTRVSLLDLRARRAPLTAILTPTAPPPDLGAPLTAASLLGDLGADIADYNVQTRTATPGWYQVDIPGKSDAYLLLIEDAGHDCRRFTHWPLA